jgi:hypothetical protein
MSRVVQSYRKDLPRLWYRIAEFTWLHLREGFACCALERGSDLQQFVPTFIAFLNRGLKLPPVSFEMSLPAQRRDSIFWANAAILIGAAGIMVGSRPGGEMTRSSE